MGQEFQRVGLLGRREHPGVNQIVADLLALLDARGVDVVLEDRLATLSHFEKRARFSKCESVARRSSRTTSTPRASKSASKSATI